MKLIGILVIVSIMLLVIVTIVFTIVFFLRKKKIKKKKISIHLFKQGSYPNRNTSEMKVTNNDFHQNQRVMEMLRYLQVQDMINYYNIMPNFYHLLEKPNQYHDQFIKHSNYLLMDVIDILCYHHYLLNPLFLINHLLNKNAGQLDDNQFHASTNHQQKRLTKQTHLFNKTQTNALSANQQSPIVKKYGNHSL